MSFFDDDAEVTQVPTPRSRTRGPRTPRSRSRLRIQRLVVALIALFIVVFALALFVRSCESHAKESAYRTYFSQVQQVITDANKVGKQLGGLLSDPSRLGRSELQSALNQVVSTQNEITTRAERIKPPGKLKALHEIFVEGMKVRLSGVVQVRAGLLAALKGKKINATARKLAALSGYFTGPDVYYNELYRTPSPEDHEQRRRHERRGSERRLLPDERLLLAQRDQERAHPRVVVCQAHRYPRRRTGGSRRQEQQQDRHPERAARTTSSRPRSAC